MEFKCSICERRISRGWYCYNCYKEYRTEIEANEPWTRFLQNEEKRRRRKPSLLYLGEIALGIGLWQVENRKVTN